MPRSLLGWLVILLVAWFLYTHFVRKVPIKP